jgi:predicted transglutaminase-like cysteine proteinase
VQANISPNAINITSSRLIVERRSTAAPLGFQIFCLQNANQCRASNHSKTNYSSGLVQALNRVNRQVNRSIRAQNDRNGDVWSLNVNRGDCEDYVLAKRAALITAGVPSGALRIATARTRWGTPHAVLVVRTNRGDLVLDNLNNSIKPWNQTGLRMIAISGANPKRWSTIG